jgi:hypothetical protein
MPWCSLLLTRWDNALVFTSIARTHGGRSTYPFIIWQWDSSFNRSTAKATAAAPALSKTQQTAITAFEIAAPVTVASNPSLAIVAAAPFVVTPGAPAVQEKGRKKGGKCSVLWYRYSVSSSGKNQTQHMSHKLMMKAGILFRAKRSCAPQSKWWLSGQVSRASASSLLRAYVMVMVMNSYAVCCLLELEVGGNKIIYI